MKTKSNNAITSRLYAVMMNLLLLMSIAAAAQEERTPVKGESPYFFVISTDAQLDQLPLKSTRAEVKIAGVIADVTITQEYSNQGKSPLEAIYTFPASTQAAVYAMEMQIGTRKIVARIEEKAKARAQYTEAKAEGKRASLLEQQRPNVFQMNVANIMPGDVITVLLRYTELLVPDGGTYQFVYPTVVGPRYAGEVSNHVNNAFLNTPYSSQGKPASYDFDIDVTLSAGLPLQQVVSSTHKITTSYRSASEAQVALTKGETNGGNRDFVLEYKLSGEQIESGLMLYEHGDENFFLLMMQPPRRIVKEELPPREYVFIVDVSGSMHGFPINTAKTLLQNLVVNLKPTDRFNVLLFESGAYWLAEQSVAATQQNVNKAIVFLDQQHGGGGTNLLAALKKAMSLPRQDEGLSRSFVVVTDGYVGVEKEAFDIIRNKADEANTFAFGIGSSVNRHLIDGMAHAGMSEPFVIMTPEQAGKEADKFRSYINYPVLTQIKKSFKGVEVYDVEPVSIPDVLAERPIIVYGKYRGKAEGSITIEGKAGKKAYKKTFDLSAVKPSADHAAIRYLWARKKIQLLDDFSTIGYEIKNQEVIDLGLKYNLLTAYTSFIAVEEKVANESKELNTVNQPLPLPEGVENSAIGFELELEEGDLSFARHKKIEVAESLSASAKKQLLASIETSLLPELNKLLEAYEVTPDAIEVNVDAAGLATLALVKGQHLPKAFVDALSKLVAAQKYSMPKLMPCRYTILF